MGAEYSEDRQDDFILSRKDALALMALMILSLMAALDGSSISVTLPAISNELNASDIETFWTGTSFLLCSAVFQPIFGYLSGPFGRKTFVLIAILFFGVGAAVAGTTHDTFRLLLGRSIQGVGGGGIITLTGVVIADYIPLDHRAKYFGYLSAAWALGSVVGPVIGGCFVEKSTWRWIFYINFPFIGIGTAATVLFMPWNNSAHPFCERLRNIDYGGIVLFISSASSFLIPLSWGGIMYPWTSWHTLVPLFLGTGGFLTFAGYESRYPSHPLIPPALFHNRSSCVWLGGYFVTGFLLWSALYYLPLYYEAVKGYSPIIAGVALFPSTLTVTPTAAVAGFVITYTGQYYYITYAGWALSTLGFGLLCLLDVDTTIPQWIFLNIVPGIGVGLSVISVALAVQASAPAELVSLMVTIGTFLRSFGQSIGVAVGGAVFENRLRANLHQYPQLSHMANQYSLNAFGVIDLLRNSDEITRSHVRIAFVSSLQIVWAVCCGISGIALVSCLFAKAYRIR
ncbi:putative MFS multidrug transporter [Aspergillus ambiguus]|uniref:putative MFS multidrug transporter n=1 Tax=Aspergillus ambiguus TaxID=176160 RepID=UPI003CCD70AF